MMIPWYFRVVLIAVIVENIIMALLSLACLESFKGDDGFPRVLMGIAVAVSIMLICVATYGMFTFQFIPPAN